MGFGDEIIGTGLARGARDQGKRVAFGDGLKISWGPWCSEIYYNNPNIAPPGSERSKDLIWIDHYKGCRKYNRLSNGKWVWNLDFKSTPGEFFFDSQEAVIAKSFKKGFVVIEPNVPWQKKVHPNKDWGKEKYEDVCKNLLSQGINVVQFRHNNSRRILPGANVLEFSKFRHAIAALSQASLFIGPEGGMHHAAAAVNVPAVVLFGGFIPPQVTGYDSHINLTGGATACGNIDPCPHCSAAMRNISVEEVLSSATRLLCQ